MKIFGKIIRKSKPKITIFLPIYNMQDYINKTLQIILDQTLKDIEIIAINDYSQDKTYEILKQFSLKDKRIKIVNNTKNYGLLYSRAMGIIHSSGEYLINLDPDDEFNNSDVLEYLYYKIKNSNVDIISFSFLEKSSMRIINYCGESNKIIKQPKLFELMYNNFPDYLIWNKIIKREILLKAYKLFENYIYYKKWNYHEDDIWTLLVHKVASSKLCVNKLVYIYNNNINKMSLMKNKECLIQYINLIYRFEMRRKILNDTIHFKYLSNQCDSLASNINYSIRFKKFIRISSELKNITIYNLKICINNYNISERIKKKIINIINTFN